MRLAVPDKCWGKWSRSTGRQWACRRRARPASHHTSYRHAIAVGARRDLQFSFGRGPSAPEGLPAGAATCRPPFLSDSAR